MKKILTTFVISLFAVVAFGQQSTPELLKNKELFEKTDLPNGTVISIKSGYQYRPEGWADKLTSTAVRPDYVTTSIVIVDEAWWGDFNYRAFNIAHEGEKADIVFGDGNALRIYVPKN